MSQNIEVILNRKTNMEAVIKIIEENIPEVTITQLFFKKKTTACLLKDIDNMGFSVP